MGDPRPGGESIRSGRRPDDGSAPMPREAGPPGDRPANRSFRAEDDDQHVSPTAPSADKPDATSIGFSTYVHDACTRPPYGRVATVSGSTRLGEAGGGGKVGDGNKKGAPAGVPGGGPLGARAGGSPAPPPRNTAAEKGQVEGLPGTPAADGIPATAAPRGSIP